MPCCDHGSSPQNFELGSHFYPSSCVENMLDSKAMKEIEKNSNGSFPLEMRKMMHCGIYQGTSNVGGIQLDWDVKSANRSKISELHFDIKFSVQLLSASLPK